MVRIAPRQRNERRKGERTVPFERVSKIDGHEESSSLVYSITVRVDTVGVLTNPVCMISPVTQFSHYSGPGKLRAKEYRQNLPDPI